MMLYYITGSVGGSVGTGLRNRWSICAAFSFLGKQSVSGYRSHLRASLSFPLVSFLKGGCQNTTAPTEKLQLSRSDVESCGISVTVAINVVVYEELHHLRGHFHSNKVAFHSLFPPPRFSCPLASMNANRRVWFRPRAKQNKRHILKTRLYKYIYIFFVFFSEAEAASAAGKKTF